MHNQDSFTKKFYANIMPKISGIGASVVIIGAMFKLLNWPGGALMLGVGLTTEAVIFFLSAFEPQAPEVDWARVYPQLADDYTGSFPDSANHPIQGGVSEKLDEMLAKAKIDAALIERLGQGMQHLSDSVASINTASNLSEATEKYAQNLSKASEALESIYETQHQAADSMEALSNTAQQAQHYQTQMQDISENLGALNNAYVNELQAVTSRTQITQEAYNTITTSMESMQNTAEETAQFKAALGQLNQKLTSLNSVYDNMLTALKT